MVSPSIVEDCQSEGSELAQMMEPPSGGGSGNTQRYGCKLESGSDFIGNTYSGAKVFLSKDKFLSTSLLVISAKILIVSNILLFSPKSLQH